MCMTTSQDLKKKLNKKTGSTKHGCKAVTKKYIDFLSFLKM